MREPLSRRGASVVSSVTRHNIECPECGKLQEVTVWDSINVDVDASLRDRLIAGEINQFECSSCGHDAFLDAPLLYHDMTRRFCVQYLSPKSLDDPQRAFHNYDAEGGQNLGRLSEHILFAYLKMPHVVFDMN